MNRRNVMMGVAAGLASIARRTSAGEPTGRPAPPLALEHWIHSPPLEIGDLRGKVVLLRWWTDGCAFCDATAPALRKLQREYEHRGLQIIGVYHPKPPGDWDMRKVTNAARDKRFTFPIALDGDWKALKRWWLDRDRDYTSVSFLLDRQGIVRYVHPGGEFHEGAQGALASHESCHRDFRRIDAEISKLLA